MLSDLALLLLLWLSRVSRVSPECDPMDGGPAGSSIAGILQARALEGVPLPAPDLVLCEHNLRLEIGCSSVGPDLHSDLIYPRKSLEGRCPLKPSGPC